MDRIYNNNNDTNFNFIYNRFPIGMLVQIENLISEPWLNKKSGNVLGPNGLGRFTIKLSDTGEEVNVRPENLIELNSQPQQVQGRQYPHHRSHSNNVNSDASSRVDHQQTTNINSLTTTFPKGTKVELFGLVIEPDLNRKRGVVHGWFNEQGRVSVTLSDTGREVHIKPKNLITLNNDASHYHQSLSASNNESHSNTYHNRMNTRHSVSSTNTFSGYGSCRLPRHPGRPTNEQPSESLQSNWQCSVCTFVNATDQASCNACMTPRRPSNEDLTGGVTACNPQQFTRTIVENDRLQAVSTLQMNPEPEIEIEHDDIVERKAVEPEIVIPAPETDVVDEKENQQWHCSHCTFINNIENNTCQACNSSRHSSELAGVDGLEHSTTATITHEDTSSDALAPEARASSDSNIAIEPEAEIKIREPETVIEPSIPSELPTSPQQWHCSHCTFINNIENSSCEACGALQSPSEANSIHREECVSRPAGINHEDDDRASEEVQMRPGTMVNPETEKLHESDINIERSEHTAYERSNPQFNNDTHQQQWHCSKCTMINNIGQDYCTACDSPRAQSRSIVDMDNYTAITPTLPVADAADQRNKPQVPCDPEIAIEPLPELQHQATPPDVSTQEDWHCSECTCINKPGLDCCEVCKSPRAPLRSVVDMTTSAAITPPLADSADQGATESEILMDSDDEDDDASSEPEVIVYQPHLKHRPMPRTYLQNVYRPEQQRSERLIPVTPHSPQRPTTMIDSIGPVVLPVRPRVSNLELDELVETEIVVEAEAEVLPGSGPDPEVIYEENIQDNQSAQDYLQNVHKRQQQREEVTSEPALLDITWEEAVSTLGDIVRDDPRWTPDKLEVVLQSSKGSLEDSIATVVANPDPDKLLLVLREELPPDDQQERPDITQFSIPSNGLKDETEIRFFPHGNDIKVSTVSFYPDGQYMVTGGSDGIARCFDLKTGLLVGRFDGRINTGVTSLSVSSDGRNLVTAEHNTVILWDFPSNRKAWTLSQHSDIVESVDISSDGNILVSGSRDGTALVCVKEESGTTSQQLTGTNIQSRSIKLTSGTVTAVALSSNRCMLVTGSSDGEIKVWDLTNGKNIRTFRGHSGSITALSICYDGSRIASGSTDTDAHLWNVASSTLENRFKGHTECVNSVSLSSDGRYLATASADKLVKVWDCNLGDEITTIEAHTKSVNGVNLFEKGRYLATASDDGYSKLFDLFSHGVGVTKFFQVVEMATNDEKNWSTERILDELSESISNVQELKLYYTACTAAFKKGEIDRYARNQYIHKVLKTAEKSLHFDKDRHVFTALKQVLKKAKSDKVIDGVEYDRLLQIYVSTDVFADFRFQSLVESIRQNNMCLETLEKRIGCAEDYAKAIDKNFKRAQKRRAVVGVVSAVIGLATFGYGTGVVSAFGDIFGSLDCVVDFADSSHILSVMEDMDMKDVKEGAMKFMENWEDRPLEDAFKCRFDQSNTSSILSIVGILQIAHGLGDVAAAGTSSTDIVSKNKSSEDEDEFSDSDIDTKLENLYPLHSAIKYGDFELLQEELLDLANKKEDYDINLKDERDRSAADYAALKGEYEMMDMIVRQGGKFYLGSRARMRALAKKKQNERKKAARSA